MSEETSPPDTFVDPEDEDEDIFEDATNFDIDDVTATPTEPAPLPGKDGDTLASGSEWIPLAEDDEGTVALHQNLNMGVTSTYSDENVEANYYEGMQRGDDEVKDPQGNVPFNLYQRQAVLYSEEEGVNLMPTSHLVQGHRSAPVLISPPVELQGNIYFNLNSSEGCGHASQQTGIQIMPSFQQYPEPLYHHQQQRNNNKGNSHGHVVHAYNYNSATPPPVFYNYNSSGQNEPSPATPSLDVPGGAGAAGGLENSDILQVKVPSWAKLNLDEEENERVLPLSSSKSASRPRLVEYIGDQYHEKNPHTRRTILLNQHRTSENDPIVFYRFYQFSCPCLGKVWFSPLHRAREGCYCRDCHQYVRPFGHIDGLTPYMGHELCYAKFQCHNCARSWSCQKSRSNFPDNCFQCGTIVYPYYQVSHSVLRRKIMRQSDNPTNPQFLGGSMAFGNSDYFDTSLEEEEEYQVFHPGFYNNSQHCQYQYHTHPQSGRSLSQQNLLQSPPPGSSSSTSGDHSHSSTEPQSPTSLTGFPNQNQSLSPTVVKMMMLGYSVSDTALVLGNPNGHFKPEWQRNSKNGVHLYQQRS